MAKGLAVLPSRYQAQNGTLLRHQEHQRQFIAANLNLLLKKYELMMLARETAFQVHRLRRQ